MRVAVLSGGRSSEHEISKRSAAAVASALTDSGHEVLVLDIERDGSWSHAGECIQLIPAGGLLGVDVVFPVLHGSYGEDGTVQGLLECLDVPYVGSDVLASAVCMDKLTFKQAMAQRGVPQVDFVAILAAEWETTRAESMAEVERLGFPVFVKPSRLGSSVGISKVVASDRLEAAIESALVYDPRVIVEQFSGGKEVECSVLEEDGEITLSRLGEISFDSDWYDYEAKYGEGGMDLIVPARIEAPVAETVARVARDSFTALGCSGLARADFFVEGDRVLVNELNTMPGFTQTSVYAKLFAASGIVYGDLIERLLAAALLKRTRTLKHSF